MANVVEIPHRQLPNDYFQEQNDFERQIQSATFTIDTSNPRNQQALTNTATGAKIKAFESNAVMWEIGKHFEEALARLAYKLLQVAYDSGDDILYINKEDGSGFYKVHKEALNDAIKRYNIVVEAWSSSYDTEEKRREDALSKWNLALQAKQAGVPVNLQTMFKNVLETYETVEMDDLFENQTLPPPMQPWMESWPGNVPKLPQNPLSPQTQNVQPNQI